MFSPKCHLKQVVRNLFCKYPVPEFATWEMTSKCFLKNTLKSNNNTTCFGRIRFSFRGAKDKVNEAENEIQQEEE